MSDGQPYLGINFYGNRLYYAVSGDGEFDLKRVGCLDFSFEVADAIREMDPDCFPGIYESLGKIRKEYNARHIRILTMPVNECWTILPKSVYDEADEREAYLDIIMKGVPRNAIEPVWYTISNRDYKLLSIRNRNGLQGIQKLAEHGHSADFCSDFEIGNFWINHCKSKGSFITISCHTNYISVSSFLLGKLRAATYITYEEIQDLPYFWLQQVQHLSWLNGLHEEICIYGINAREVYKSLKPYLDRNTKIIEFDTLKKMKLTAQESAYSFNLQEAFPAIMLAIGK